MPTFNQLIKKKRINKKKRMYKLLGLEGNPFKRGTCVNIRGVKPKKPNSAIRKIARVILVNNKEVTAYIPGQGHALKNFGNVMVRGGRVKDVPGIRYKLVRGKLDFKITESFPRVNKRSKYGVPKEEGERRKNLIKELMQK